MKSKKIYFSWLEEYKEFYPTGMLPNENIRYTPKQGYGVCEIAAWLSNDLQYSINSVNIWINNLTDLSSSPAPDGYFGIGNAHWVTVVKDLVFICCEYVEEQKVIMTIDQLLYILMQYKEFLEGNYNDPTNPPDPLDIEYIAEGKEALNLYCKLTGYTTFP